MIPDRPMNPDAAATMDPNGPVGGPMQQPMTPEQMEARREADRKRKEIEAKKNKALKEYFANKPRGEIAAKLIDKVDEYYEHLRVSGRLGVLQTVYEHYYAGMMRRAKINKSGKENEYYTMAINHFRNTVQHVLVKTTSQKIAPDPKATNTDLKSMSQAIVAKGILDHYDRTAQVDRFIDRAAENAYLLSEAYVSTEWDAILGEEYAPDLANPGSFHKKGDIDVRCFNALSVAYDFTQQNPDKRPWIITIRFENKYDYCARFPELADRIASVSIDRAQLRNRHLGLYDYQDSDLIPVYRFYHDKTPAVPNGRFTEFLSSNIVTLDGALPYRKDPVKRIVPDVQEGTPWGYTIAFDMAAVQEAINGLVSTILTGQATFGVGNIWMPNQLNASVEQVLAGLNVIKGDGKFGKPEAINLTQTPAEIFRFLDMLVSVIRTLAGINDVVIGNPGPEVKSGSYGALLASQAIEFNSKFQKSYAKLQEDVYTSIIEILKDNADQPRLIEIAGKAKRSYMKQFTGENISEINRVVVDVGNPLSRTTAGKLQIADSLLERGLIKTPEEYINIITTGQLEPLYEGDQSQLMLIRSENERLSDENEIPQEGQPDQFGQPQVISTVHALLTDDQMLHIKEHMVVLSSPEARENPNIVKNTLAHLKEHIGLLMSGDPLLALMGQPNLAPPPPPEGKNPAEEVTDPRNPTEKKADDVNMPNEPNMPVNPMSGNRFNNENGGLQ